MWTTDEIKHAAESVGLRFVWTGRYVDHLHRECVATDSPGRIFKGAGERWAGVTLRVCEGGPVEDGAATSARWVVTEQPAGQPFTLLLSLNRMGT